VRTRNDLHIQNDIERQIDWESRLDSQCILIRVSNGVVRLYGAVCHPAQRLIAEQAVRSVAGVREVLSELHVKSHGIESA
jgi:osmotically-inducible protein OsmY